VSLLENWVKTPLAEALGWALFHSLWEGALIAAALIVALRFIRSSGARYWAACLALIVIVGGFAVTLFCVLPESGRSFGAARAPMFPTWRVVAEFGGHGPGQTALANVIPWLAPLWLLGVSLFYLRNAAGWISAGRLRRRGVCCAPERWQSKLSELAGALRVSRPTALLESCLAAAPVVIGHFRPIVLMPVGMLTGLPAAQVEAILLHEFAHIRRCDYLVNVWQRLVEGLLFYHPAVWWISRVMRTERENCCDDAAVAWSGDAHGYAVALAALEQNRCSGREPAVAATGGNLIETYSSFVVCPRSRLAERSRHIYIVYGPADEVEAHPGGAPTPYPYQTWRYRHVGRSGRRPVRHLCGSNQNRRLSARAGEVALAKARIADS
jgi:hypothetical protein